MTIDINTKSNLSRPAANSIQSSCGVGESVVLMESSFSWTRSVGISLLVGQRRQAYLPKGPVSSCMAAGGGRTGPVSLQRLKMIRTCRRIVVTRTYMVDCKKDTKWVINRRKKKRLIMIDVYQRKMNVSYKNFIKQD